MFCVYCGSKVDESCEYCGNCGYLVYKGEIKSPTPTKPNVKVVYVDEEPIHSLIDSSSAALLIFLVFIISFGFILLCSYFTRDVYIETSNHLSHIITFFPFK